MAPVLYGPLRIWSWIHAPLGAGKSEDTVVGREVGSGEDKVSSTWSEENKDLASAGELFSPPVWEFLSMHASDFFDCILVSYLTN